MLPIGRCTANRVFRIANGAEIARKYHRRLYYSVLRLPLIIVVVYVATILLLLFSVRTRYAVVVTVLRQNRPDERAFRRKRSIRICRSGRGTQTFLKRLFLVRDGIAYAVSTSVSIDSDNNIRFDGRWEIEKCPTGVFNTGDIIIRFKS